MRNIAPMTMPFKSLNHYLIHDRHAKGEVTNRSFGLLLMVLKSWPTLGDISLEPPPIPLHALRGVSPLKSAGNAANFECNHVYCINFDVLGGGFI